MRDARALRRRSAMGAGWASLRACPPVAAPSGVAIRFLLRRDGVPMAWLSARQSVLCVEASVLARGHCVVGSAAARHRGRRPPASCCKRERCDSTSRSATAAAVRLQRGGVGPRGDGASLVRGAAHGAWARPCAMMRRAAGAAAVGWRRRGRDAGHATRTVQAAVGDLQQGVSSRPRAVGLGPRRAICVQPICDSMYRVTALDFLEEAVIS